MSVALGEDDARYEVFIAKYGTRSALRSEVFLNYGLYHEPDGQIGMDYFLWVLRNRQRTILVDTGFSPSGGASRGRTELASVAEVLAALGVDPNGVPTVVLTHAHYDHAGNVGLFPRSRILASAQELEFWKGEHVGKVLFHHSVDDDALAALDRARVEGRLDLFSGSCRVAPGVEVLEVGGHTPGQAVVKVDTYDGTILLASDSVHYYEELERDMPFSSVADVVAMYDAFAWIRKMIESGEVRDVVSGHDPSTLDRFPARPDVGELSQLIATVGGPRA